LLILPVARSAAFKLELEFGLFSPFNTDDCIEMQLILRASHFSLYLFYGESDFDV
jgi:hypothetical protein